MPARSSRQAHRRRFTIGRARSSSRALSAPGTLFKDTISTSRALSARATLSKAKVSMRRVSTLRERRCDAVAKQSRLVQRRRFLSARTTSRSRRRSGRGKTLCRRRWCGRAFSAASGTIWLRLRTARNCACLPAPVKTSRKAAPFGCICHRTAAVLWQNDEIEGRDDKNAHGGKSMIGSGISRRDVLIGSSAFVAGAAFSTKVMSAAPPASAVTPQLIEAAKKEGKVVWYTSVDLPLAEKIAKSFEAKYPCIAVRVERTGAERVFQRIGQE